jgi:FAD/FMN-containing dehydrogenase
MNYPTLTASHGVAALRSKLAGDVVVPGDDTWDVARQAWNRLADQQPLAVVLAESADDVVETVRHARENGLRIAAQGTGHGAVPLGLGDDTLLLKTARMTGVTIDPEGRRARAEAGAIWTDVTEPAAEHGLAALHGSSPDVGVVGYTLGGGLGWLARKTVSRRTASRPSRSSPPTATTCAWTTTTSPTCSGPCAAAAEASAS